MPQLLSEDFVRNKIGKLMAGRAERVFRDSKLTGFLLRARHSASGALLATWFIERRTPGRKNAAKVIIGDYPTFPAAQARELAQAMLQAVKRGDDPAAERAAKRTAARWEDLVAAFRERHLGLREDGEPSGHPPQVNAATGTRYQGVTRRVLSPAFKGCRVADITTTMIAAVHARKAAAPAEANNSLRCISSMMSFATREGLRSGVNPAFGIARYPDRERERWLDEEELPKFLAALAPETDACNDLIRFIAVTGWRVNDARLLDWSQVDLPNRKVSLADSRTKKRGSVLSADAAVLIDRQGGRVGAVFSRHARRPLDYEHVLGRLRELCTKAGIAPITPHVLRHTAATWAAVNGADLVELRDAFGWRTLSMPNRYIKKADTVARRGAERVAAAINVLGKSAAEVVELAAAKR
jgi:integrase